MRHLFIDFDSYFASVEQQHQPHLRGKPLGVLPTLAETTCCIASSYEARAFSVKTGTKVKEARMLCPQIQFTEARPHLYVQIHKKILNVIEKHIHIDAVKSVDEMHGTVPHQWRNPQKLNQLVVDLKAELSRQIGPHITCSVGIAPNVFLAKLASALNKPNGIYLIQQEDIPRCYDAIQLRDLYGVGARMLKRIHRFGIRQVAELYQADRATLYRIWGGIEGNRMYARLRGENLDEYETRRRHISHSHVLAPDKRNPADALAVSHRLLQKATARMRNYEYYAGSLYLSIRYGRDIKWSDTLQFHETQSTRELTNHLLNLWKKSPDYQEPSKLSVVLGNLNMAHNHTPSLFSGERSMRNAKLDKAMDTLNQRYGTRMVYYGGAHSGRHSAPMRIAFNHIPDLELEKD